MLIVLCLFITPLTNPKGTSIRRARKGLPAMFCYAYPKRHLVVGGEPKTPRRPLAKWHTVVVHIP